MKLSEGSIRLSGEDLAKASEARMCQVRNGAISMIFQDPMASLNPVQTVGSQIVEAIRSHRGVGRREARQQAIELLKRVAPARPGDADRRLPAPPLAAACASG